jgi:predicted HAD superfamily Cof-like phosphohydrolase
MKREIDMVGDFHRQFEAPVLSSPEIPDADRCALKIRLIQEELNEIKDAIAESDMVEIKDGVADLLYVTFGLINEFGLTDCISQIFDEVHRSNMTKSCKTMEEAEETVKFYKTKDNTESYIKPVGDAFVVYRTSDNKVLKSINYSPANIK